MGANAHIEKSFKLAHSRRHGAARLRAVQEQSVVPTYDERMAEGVSLGWRFEVITYRMEDARGLKRCQGPLGPAVLNAGALSVPQSASALGISAAHCRALAHKLEQHDVAQALVDKREGQRRDYRVGPEQKAELIQQLAARAITGHDASSEVLAEQVSERTGAGRGCRREQSVGTSTISGCRRSANHFPLWWRH